VLLIWPPTLRQKDCKTSLALSFPLIQVYNREMEGSGEMIPTPFPLPKL